MTSRFVAPVSALFLVALATACSGTDGLSADGDQLASTEEAFSIDPTRVCYIYLETNCTNYTQYKGGSWFVDTVNSSTSLSPSACLSRARAWHAWCGLPSGTYVNAAWNLGSLGTMVAQQVRGPGREVYTFGPGWEELPARSYY